MIRFGFHLEMGWCPSDDAQYTNEFGRRSTSQSKLAAQCHLNKCRKCAFRDEESSIGHCRELKAIWDEWRTNSRRIRSEGGKIIVKSKRPMSKEVWEIQGSEDPSKNTNHSRIMSNSVGLGRLVWYVGAQDHDTQFKNIHEDLSSNLIHFSDLPVFRSCHCFL
jgi:hypothetical protein